MKLSVKDPGSALTHFIAMILAVLAAAPLLLKAAFFTDRLHVAALAVFIVSMILLYAASTVYHTFDISEGINRLLRKIDHMMIFVLIAGTYTPVCLIVLGNSAGYRLLALVWATCSRGHPDQRPVDQLSQVVSSCIYIAMGWICVTAFGQILSSLTPGAFGWLLAGGIIYTAGGVIYALKLPLFNSRHKNFGSSRDLSPVCHGRELLSLYDDVWLSGRSLIQGASAGVPGPGSCFSFLPAGG